MPNRVVKSAVVTVFLLSGISIGSAAQAAPIPASYSRDDMRLAKRVTFTATRLSLSQLLAKISKETGVSLSLGESVPGKGDAQVSVILGEASLIDALNALHSALGHQGEDWHWARTGVLPRFQYVLLRPKPTAAAGGTRRPQLAPRSQMIQVDLHASNGKALAGFSRYSTGTNDTALCWNGGFEQVLAEKGRDRPTGWGAFGAVGQNLVINEARSGMRAGQLNALDKMPAGFNWECQSLTMGIVRFWYKAAASSVDGQNLVFYVIPLRAGKSPGALEEAVIQGQATARVRWDVPPEQVGDGRWHLGTLFFDFKGLGVERVVFAPRINELTSASGTGQLLIDDVEIVATPR